MLVAATVLLAVAAEPPTVVVDRDDVVIDASCRLEIAETAIADANGDGVVHISGNDIEVDLNGWTLIGASRDVAPNEYAGVGIRVTGRNVVLRNGDVRGFKCAIHATGADGLVIENVDVSGNFRQRLRSTAAAEDSGDWLWPHANDDNEWLTNYGAAIYIEDAREVTVRRVTCRDTQNGIILDRVEDGRIYDNDCSFLSGWGLALWRSSKNVITRNAFDFCIRGYSHGVYNRGQDSAGILLFEQCHDNVIALNSATHGGDGFFAFSGREALGEVDPRDDEAWYVGRGHTGNVIADNDFSYAAAHGLELTFAFDNLITRNQFTGNAICGIWGGYSQNLEISSNRFHSNGDAGYGRERGGINIEHGAENVIFGNDFRDNECGIFLWWDEDPHLLKLPWAKANERGSVENVIARNGFTADEVAIELSRTGVTRIRGNTIERVERQLVADDESLEAMSEDVDPELGLTTVNRAVYLGRKEPIGARRHLKGRDKIVMTEWGPYDWERPHMRRRATYPGIDVWEMMGENAAFDLDRVTVEGNATVALEGNWLLVRGAAGAATPYRLLVEDGHDLLTGDGLILATTWNVRHFQWTTDPQLYTDEQGAITPRDDDADRLAAWRAEGAANGYDVERKDLLLAFGSGGPDGMDAADRFGTIASTTVTLPAGSWRLATRSDDGIRVWLDDELVIDDWTWHGPRDHDHSFELAGERAVTIRVEHFELDGYSVCEVKLEAH